MRKVILGVIAALLAVFVLAVPGSASIPDSSSGKITACYHNSTGNLRAIDKQAGASCTGSETELSWYKSPSSGKSRTVTTLSYSAGTAVHVTGTAQCPAGKIATGGGFDAPDRPGDIIDVRKDGPASGNDVAWVFDAYITSNSADQVLLTVLCEWEP